MALLHPDIREVEGDFVLESETLMGLITMGFVVQQVLTHQ